MRRRSQEYDSQAYELPHATPRSPFKYEDDELQRALDLTDLAAEDTADVAPRLPVTVLRARVRFSFFLGDGKGKTQEQEQDWFVCRQDNLSVAVCA